MFAVAAGGSAQTEPHAPLRLSLPEPTGPYQRRYLTAWFDWALRGRARPLLRGEASRFPEVDFQP